MTQALNESSAAEIARRIRSGETTAEAVMAACLARIEEREGTIGAFTAIDPDMALAKARATDQHGSPEAPLRGVPFAIKDIIDTVDLPTAWGSPIYAGHQPVRNASCVELFLAAGAVPIGKSVTTEFAYFSPGKTGNPHNPAHTPGGSSSGTAAAVADHMVPLGFGSQTAASVIRPASFCGVLGYKATQGGFDLQGVMGLCPSLDTLGVMAREVDDLVLARAALCGSHVSPVNPFEDRAPRIALMRGPHWDEGSIEMRDVCQRALKAFADAGAETGELAHPDVFDELTDAQKTVMAYETFHARLFEYNNHRDRISPQFRDLMEQGASMARSDFERALRVRDTAYRLLETMFTDIDAILAPAAPGEAPEGLGATGDPLYSRGWTLLQVPCVAIPHGTGPNNLPLSVQLIAPKLADDRLLQAAIWAHRVLRA